MEALALGKVYSCLTSWSTFCKESQEDPELSKELCIFRIKLRRVASVLPWSVYKYNTNQLVVLSREIPSLGQYSALASSGTSDKPRELYSRSCLKIYVLVVKSELDKARIKFPTIIKLENDVLEIMPF